MRLQVLYFLDRAMRHQYRLRILPRIRWHVIRGEDAEQLLRAKCAELVIPEKGNDGRETRRGQ